MRRAGWHDEPPPAKRGIEWKRYVRTPKAAVGFGLLAAFALLWPFSGFSVVPLLVGLGALVVLRLLRLDGILRGWDLPLGGLVVVVGLMWSTGPWAWALAASIGVLIAGLFRLPAWQLVAVGAVLCVVTGVGFGFSQYRTAEQQRADLSAGNDPERENLGESRPDLVLPALMKAISLDDADPVCRDLRQPAEDALVAAVSAPSCAAAVTALHQRLPGGTYDRSTLPQPVQTATGWEVDGCSSVWATTVGRQLGRIQIVKTASDVGRYAVSGLAPCP
jgi:hypothetical protein